MSKKINTAILAFGMSGKVFHAPFINANEHFNFYAGLKRHQSRIESLYPNVKYFEDFDTLLTDSEIELIVINTPNFTHFEFAKKALLAGKHILIEKPFTTTFSEADTLFNLAKEQNKWIFVYQNRRFDSGFKAFKAVVDSNYLGKLVEVHFRFDRYRNQIGPKLFKEEKMPGSGLLYDLGPHLIDQAISLFGKPIKFIKTLSYNREKTQVDDYFQIHLSYPNQLQVFLTSSFLVADSREAFIAHSSKGSFLKMHADVQEKQLLNGLSPLDPTYGWENPNDHGQLTYLNDAGDFSKTKWPSEQGNYMEFFDAVYKSLRKGQAFPITKLEILWQIKILESPNEEIVSI